MREGQKGMKEEEVVKPKKEDEVEGRDGGRKTE